jgi:hypothetical protein
MRMAQKYSALDEAKNQGRKQKIPDYDTQRINPVPAGRKLHHTRHRTRGGKAERSQGRNDNQESAKPTKRIE